MTCTQCQQRLGWVAARKATIYAMVGGPVTLCSVACESDWMAARAALLAEQAAKVSAP